MTRLSLGSLGNGLPVTSSLATALRTGDTIDALGHALDSIDYRTVVEAALGPASAHTHGSWRAVRRIGTGADTDYTDGVYSVRERGDGSVGWTLTRGPSVAAAAAAARGELLAAAYATGAITHAALTLPAEGVSATDPDFGSRITGVTGVPGELIVTGDTGGPVWMTGGAGNRHLYSSVSAFSASDTYLVVKSSHNEGKPQLALRSGAHPFAVIRMIYPSRDSQAMVATEWRWLPGQPTKMFCVSGSWAWTFDVLTDAVTDEWQVTGATSLHIGPFSGNLSLDGSRALLCDVRTATVEGSSYTVADTLYLVDVPGKALLGTSAVVEGWYYADYTSIDSTGVYVLANGAATAPTGGEVYEDVGDRTYVYNASFVQQRVIDGYGLPSHWDSGKDSAGNPVICGVAKGGTNAGEIITARLDTGAVQVHTADGGYVDHTSMRCTDRPGWALATYPIDPSNTYDVFEDEAVYVPLDGSLATERLVATRSTRGSYWAEAQASAMTSGNGCIFASDNGNGANTVGAWVAEYPEVT